MAAEVRIVIAQSGSGSAAADAKKQITELGAAASESGGHFSSLHEIAVGALRHIGEIALDAGVSAIKALGAQIGDSISAARESNQIFAQTEQVIKSTGGAAGLTAQQVADYASSLSAAAGKSLFGDEQIQQSANLLLTFTNIKGHALEAATAMSVDMAQAMGGAPKDAAIQLGKALNDPIKGITALSRVGVTFDNEQKKLIKTYQAHGETAKAQQVILDELNKEFGGSAAAAAKADGGWAQFNDRMGEAKETIGKAILPLLGQLAGFLNDTVAPFVEKAAAGFSALIKGLDIQGIAGFFKVFEDGSGVFSDFLQSLGVSEGVAIAVSQALSAIQGAIGGVIDAFRETGPLSDEFGEAIGGLAQALGLPAGAADVLEQVIFAVQGAIASAMATFSDARTPVEGFLNVLSSISPGFAVLRGVVEAALPPIQAIVMSVFGIISGFLSEHGAKIQADVMGAWQAIQGLINAVLPPIQAIVAAVFGAIATFLQAHGEEIKTFLGTTWDTIAQIVTLAVQLIQAIIVPIFTAIAGFLQAHGTEIQGILTASWNAIKAVIDAALTLIKGVITAALQIIKGDWSGAWETIKQMCARIVTDLYTIIKSGLDQIVIVWNLIWNSVKNTLESLLNGISGYIIQTMVGIANSIRTFGQQAISAAESLGGSIISGIIGGIKNGVGALESAVEHAAQAALDAAKAALGIGSPSRAFALHVGGPIMQGIGSGMQAELPGVIAQVQTLAGQIIESAHAAITHSSGGGGGHGGGSMLGSGVILSSGGAFPGGAVNSSVTNSSHTMHFSPTYNNVASPQGMDYALAASIAGV